MIRHARIALALTFLVIAPSMGFSADEGHKPEDGGSRLLRLFPLDRALEPVSKQALTQNQAASNVTKDPRRSDTHQSDPSQAQ